LGGVRGRFGLGVRGALLIFLLQSEEEFGVAELDDVAIEEEITLDLRAVHSRAVGALGIDEPEEVSVVLDCAVLP